MRLAFNKQGKYTDFKEGYELYVKRSRLGNFMDEKTYRKVVKAYCRMMADRIYEEGMVDLPGGLGSIMAATITRKPQYRGDKFIGYGKYDYEKGHFDGKLKTFGMVFLPRRQRTQNLRCYGFVANRRLFQKVKEKAIGFGCNWRPIEFNDDMV